MFNTYQRKKLFKRSKDKQKSYAKSRERKDFQNIV